MRNPPYRRIRKAFTALEDLVFPPICAGCRERGSWLCTACLAELKLIARPICTRCGQPGEDECDGCANCYQWPAAMGAVRAAFEFDGPLRAAIHRYKYQSEYARGPALGDLLVAAIERNEFDEPVPWDLVTYVPLHAHRKRQRGFDQSRLLAQTLAERIGLPHSAQLIRAVDTPSQVGLGAVERKANVANAFAWTGEDLKGARVLIVDDVITTGATIVAASVPLIRAGAARVDGLAVARELYR